MLFLAGKKRQERIRLFRVGLLCVHVLMDVYIVGVHITNQCTMQMHGEKRDRVKY